MRFDVMTQDTDQQTHSVKVATGARVTDIVDDHASDQDLAVRRMDEIVAEFSGNNIWQMLVLRNRIDFFLGELA